MFVIIHLLFNSKISPRVYRGLFYLANFQQVKTKIKYYLLCIVRMPYICNTNFNQ